MTTLRKVPNRSDDPCWQIQVDLSAMLDGELEASLVRRVLVHSDACPSCRGFLDGIRLQARAHVDLHRIEHADAGDLVELGFVDDAGSPIRLPADELRRELTENRRRLARIFYELGRGFVLMGISPKFSRIVQREPVPLPDMFQRARNLLDEVDRMTVGLPGADTGAFREQEWVRARELFDNGQVRTPTENLAKGTELLRESLLLVPDFHEARIHLGHALHLADRTAEAQAEFETVLATADVGVETRAYALLNLGNIHLDEGRLDRAIGCFLELVDSGVVARSAEFGLTHFNLALAYGLAERFEECESWLERLYRDMPHKRRLIADQFRLHEFFAETLARHPQVQRAFAKRFPAWFPIQKAV